VKKYTAPELEVKISSLKVVMLESDVELDMGDLDLPLKD
jgi:hypothetical protein